MSAKTKPKQQQQETPDLHDIANVPETVNAFGRDYHVGRFVLGQMAQALEFVGPVGYLLKWLAEFPVTNGKIQINPAQAMELTVRLAAISGPSLIGLVSIATREPVEWLEEQEDVMGGLRIFAKVLEKNLDFFTQENIAEATGIFKSLAERIQDVGGAR